MKATYGAFDRTLASSLDQLKVTFHAAAMPLKWMHCGLTADVFAAYYGPEFADESRRDEQRLGQAEMSSCIRYAINELLENAVKFHSPGDILIRSKIVYASIVFVISNVISDERAQDFDAYLKAFVEEDSDELMRRRIEASAQSDSKESGIGFLTLMNDYGAVLGWNLESVGDDRVLVETMLRLSLYKKDETVVDSVGFTKKR